MKLKQYVKHLNELLESNPEYAELSVVYATDGEGNYFHPVNNLATPAYSEEPDSYYLDVMFDEYDDEPNLIVIN